MKCETWAITLLTIGFMAATVDAQESRLQRVRAEAPAPSQTSTVAASPGSDDRAGVLGDFLNTADADGQSVGGTLMLLSVLAPFYVPAALLGDDYRDRLYFAPHPYANQYHGYQLLALDLANATYATSTDDVRRKSWAARVSVENGNDFAGLNRFNGQLRIDHMSRFGVITNWNYFRENLWWGRTAEATMGDTNVIFRFAQNEVASAYAGLGFRMLADRWRTDTGFNFTYGGDWFPVRPLVVSTVFDAGTLGHTSAFHARGTVGAIWRDLEFFTGYDFLRIGVTNLQGPLVGVRLWF